MFYSGHVMWDCVMFEPGDTEVDASGKQHLVNNAATMATNADKCVHIDKKYLRAAWQTSVRRGRPALHL